MGIAIDLDIETGIEIIEEIDPYTREHEDLRQTIASGHMPVKWLADSKSSRRKCRSRSCILKAKTYIETGWKEIRSHQSTMYNITSLYLLRGSIVFHKLRGKKRREKVWKEKC